MKRKFKLFVFFWTVGIFGAALFLFLKAIGSIEIRGYERKKFEHKGKGLILLSNHPSLWEPIWLPFLFFPQYCFSESFMPFSTPDKYNYYMKWWYWPLRLVSIPVARGIIREEIRALRGMLNCLKRGGVLILFPEGGRTYKGECFKVSQSGKKLRRFKFGVKKLICDSHPSVVPVWSEGGNQVMQNGSSQKFALPFPKFWKKTIIRIGNPLLMEEVSPEDIVDFLEDSLLKLAEE